MEFLVAVALYFVLNMGAAYSQTDCRKSEKNETAVWWILESEE